MFNWRKVACWEEKDHVAWSHEFADRAQLRRLGCVVDGARGSLSRVVVGRMAHHAFVGVASFLKGGVVEGAVGVETVAQGDVLRGRWAQTEREGTSHCGSSHWCSRERVTVAPATSPTDTAKYDVDQRARLCVSRHE